MAEFTPFPKIARLRRHITITEKIDGTNAAVRIVPCDGAYDGCVALTSGYALLAQSRNRFITPASDNYGFAAWVHRHAEELVGLGEGIHFGEWWGPGIQRGYGVRERTFSLFNTSRWTGANPPPDCCSVVPVLYSGPFSEAEINGALTTLSVSGSIASPGFMRPEGIVVYFPASGGSFKVTLENDGEPKSRVAA